ncbi:MAG: hypothetical protein HC921_12835 [Synechococcaceae cyanobacterium SM2_3_1]|nr:hypothetical protein [Synechococcaceae cyanobacterium SM2_3_1]
MSRLPATLPPLPLIIPYYGTAMAANIVFNSNLQEFGNKVELICSLETEGKLGSKEAYNSYN